MPGRPKGSRNKTTVRSIAEVGAARRKLRRLFGDDMAADGVPMSTALVLVELTRSIYESPTRLGAAKELSAIEYPRPKPVEVDAVSGRAVLGGAEDNVIQVELWSDQEEVA